MTSSILVAEVYAFSTCFDFAYTLEHNLDVILGREIPLHLFTDSKSLFDTIRRLSGVAQKRLLIEKAALREAYTKAEISNVGDVLSADSLADVLTKKTR